MRKLKTNEMKKAMRENKKSLINTMPLERSHA